MKRLLLVLACMSIGATAVAKSVHVKGYVKKDGTYVAPHYRSAPDSSKLNNYSTQGNYNPYTGQEGTKPAYDSYDSSDSDSSHED
jgi:hypothetical protein